jgi:hypothetical protein
MLTTPFRWLAKVDKGQGKKQFLYYVPRTLLAVVLLLSICF